MQTMGITNSDAFLDKHSCAVSDKVGIITLLQKTVEDEVILGLFLDCSTAATAGDDSFLITGNKNEC